MDARPEAAAAEDDSPGRPQPRVSPAPAGVSCELQDAHGLLSASESRRLGRLLEAAADWFARMGHTGEFRVAVVGDARMTDLHARHKGEASTTDVLTFDLAEEAGALDTDIVVCADEARRQAQARGHGVGEELALYAVHGLLHCTGYDDHDEEGEFGARAMHAREDEILSAIGAGVVFAARGEMGPEGGR